MNEILHANIFFVIASIGTVVFLLLISIILFHVIKIIKSIRRIVEKIEAGSEILADDVANLRAQIVNGGFISRLFGLFMDMSNFGNGFGAKTKATKRSKRRKVDDEEEE